VLDYEYVPPGVGESAAEKKLRNKRNRDMEIRWLQKLDMDAATDRGLDAADTARGRQLAAERERKTSARAAVRADRVAAVHQKLLDGGGDGGGGGVVESRSDPEELPTVEQFGGGGAPATQPQPLAPMMLMAFALALAYIFRSWLYAMLAHVANECVRAVLVYGGLYMVGMRVYKAVNG
jgi:ABC-type Na+ efflux pump permease subunit